MTDMGDLDELRALTAQLGHTQQADILIYNGEISRPVRRPVRTPPRSSAPLGLPPGSSTHGGSADAAYRLARALRRRYTHLTVFVDDYCKGAGMLLALAAHELVILPTSASLARSIWPLNTPSARDRLQRTRRLHGARTPSTSMARSPHSMSRCGCCLSPMRQAKVQLNCPLASSFAVGLLAPVLSRRDPGSLPRSIAPSARPASTPSASDRSTSRSTGWSAC